MSIQARLSESDPRLYNANRDVAHNFREVMIEVAARIEDERWPELVAILQREKTTMDELGKACQAYCQFVTWSADNPKETMQAVLVRAGWFDVAPAAQVAYMAVLGTVISGYYFSGVREATLGGVGPALRYQELAEHGKACSQLMQMSRWRRWYVKRWETLKRAVAMFRS